MYFQTLNVFSGDCNFQGNFILGTNNSNTFTVNSTTNFVKAPNYSGTALLASLTDGTIATCKFVKDQGYLSSITGGYVDTTTAQTVAQVQKHFRPYHPILELLY